MSNDAKNFDFPELGQAIQDAREQQRNKQRYKLLCFPFFITAKLISTFLEYSIGELSRLTNLGIHTLRYYEHENLITPKRNSGNRRCYWTKTLHELNLLSV